MSGDHPNYSIVENNQNTEKSLGDLRRLEETCCHSSYNERPSAKADVKNSQKVNNNNNNGGTSCQIRILDKALCISLHTNALGISMNPSLLSLDIAGITSLAL